MTFIRNFLKTLFELREKYSIVRFTLILVIRNTSIFFFRKGYISAHDLAQVFALLNESVTEDEITSKSEIEDISPKKFLQSCFFSNDSNCGRKIE